MYDFQEVAQRSFSELACAAQAQQLLGAQGYEVYLSRAIFPDSVPVSFF
jgi:hypothetical protein